MQAKLVTESGEILGDEWAYDAREIKAKLGKLAAYTCKQGIKCRIDVYHDADDNRLGDRAGTFKGYYGPLLGLQGFDGYKDDWYSPKEKANRGAVSRPKIDRPIDDTPKRAPGRPRIERAIDDTPRRPVGRPKGEPKPPKEPTERKRVHPLGSTPYPSIYLLPEQAVKARIIGNGNLSVGIRAAIDALPGA